MTIRPNLAPLVLALVLAPTHRCRAASSELAEVGSEPCASDRSARPSSRRHAAAVAAAVVPALVVHGVGHFVDGQPCTAVRLAEIEAVGLGGTLVGGSTLFLSGASRYLVGPAITLTIAGISLVLVTYLADVYGVSGGARLGFEPERVRPSWEAELGLLRVSNPRFDFAWLLTQQVAHNLGAGRIVGALDTALDGTHAQYRLGGAFRFAGPRPDRSARDGSFLDLYAGLAEQRYVLEGFVSDLAEVSLSGRLDLVRIGPSLSGAFAELSTGVALFRTDYHLNGVSVAPDYESLLLGRIAFGAYLGRGQRRGSEVVAYYDHRHDDYAAGLKIPGLGSGALGHFGLSGRYFFSPQLGFGLMAEAGSAYVTQVSLLFRAGGGA